MAMSCGRGTVSVCAMGLGEMVLVLIGLSTLVVVHGMEAKSLNRELNPPHEHTLETVQTEDGDIFDCIDMNKQPGLNHPLAGNHKIQLRPSSYPKFEDSYQEGASKDSYIDAPIRFGLENEICPPGTIPLQRTYKDSLTGYLSDSTEVVTHDATYSPKPGEYFGTRAFLNIWGDYIRFPMNKSTSSRICVRSGEGSGANEICAGWMVNSAVFGDSQTRFFVGWTSDNYKSTGCVNLNCEAFIQVNEKLPLGTILPPSTYGGLQAYLDLRIYQDNVTKDWWIGHNNNEADQIIGYYPSYLFNTLNQSATNVAWGGFTSAIANDVSPPMGSGHFAIEKYLKASFIGMIQLMDKSNIPFDLKGYDQIPHMTSPGCYTLTNYQFFSSRFHFMFFFGGPGGDCRK